MLGSARWSSRPVARISGLVLSSIRSILALIQGSLIWRSIVCVVESDGLPDVEYFDSVMMMLVDGTFLIGTAELAVGIPAARDDAGPQNSTKLSWADG